MPLFSYKITLKYQDEEINQLMKKEQIMACSRLFWKQKCENLKKIRLTFFKLQFIEIQSIYD